MKTFFLLLLLPILMSAGLTLRAAEAVSPAPAPAAEMSSTERLPGVDLAEGISQITGTAFSPVLGVSAIGAWRYFHTAAELRPGLPWFCHPAAWGIGFGVLLLCFLKDSFGTVAPPLLKKPLDLVELLENKASALVASSAFVPLVAAQMTRHIDVPAQAQHPAAVPMHLASVLPGASLEFMLQAVAICLCVAAFAVVWLSAHAINVLIAICPFGLIDAALKIVKLAMLSSIAIAYAIAPTLGAILSCAVIAAAALLAPAAFRFMIFGGVMASDVLFPWRARRKADPTMPHAFATRRTGVAARTYGRVHKNDDGSMTFSYRPWLVFARKSVALPNQRLIVGKGLFFPSLLISPDDSTKALELVVFSPRYRSLEQAMADRFEIDEIRHSPLSKGFKAIKTWLGDALNAGRSWLSAPPTPSSR